MSSRRWSIGCRKLRAYVFHGENNAPLVVGAAGNLKLHIVNYFRLDQATDKALEYSHRITNITWRATRGMLGAQLHAAALDCVHFAMRSAR
jgi:DNA polymerase-3 subunit epsilon